MELAHGHSARPQVVKVRSELMLFLLICDSSLISKETKADAMHFQVIPGLLTGGARIHESEITLLCGGNLCLKSRHDTYPYLYHPHALRTEEQADRQRQTQPSPGTPLYGSCQWCRHQLVRSSGEGLGRTWTPRMPH